MRYNTSNKCDVYNHVTKIINAAVNHTVAVRFRKEALESYGFYDGTGQWSQEDEAILASRNQPKLTVNFIQTLINALCGVEIQSMYRITCKSGSFDEYDVKLSEAITNLLYVLQEKHSMPRIGSWKFMSGLICGLGWSDIFPDKRLVDIINYKYVSPFDVYPDFSDLTKDFSSMSYVCRQHWLRKDFMKLAWPKDWEDISRGGSSEENFLLYNPQTLQRRSAAGWSSSYSDGGTTLRVWECQYVKSEMAYSFMSSGRLVQTFDDEVVESLADNANEVTEYIALRRYKALVCGDCLLENAPLDPDIPDTADFSLVPFVWARTEPDGVPYGLVAGLKDLQRDFNVRLAKALHTLNSKRIIIQTDSLSDMDRDKVVQELIKPDSITFLPKESVVDVRDNNIDSAEQVKFSEFLLGMTPRVSGIQDEMLGMTTNTTSAIGQNVKQVNSVRTNVFGFDALNAMKTREGRVIIDILQSGDFSSIAVQMVNDDDAIMHLNQMVQLKDGNVVLVNDIRHLPLTLYVEESPNYRSTKDEIQDLIGKLLSNQNAKMLMLSPGLLKLMGIRNADIIAAEMQAALGFEEPGIKTSRPVDVKNKVDPTNPIDAKRGGN